MANNQGITVEQLYEECAKQIKAGNGKRHIMISEDDEGNGYHELFIGFSPDYDFSELPNYMLPYGVSAEMATRSYIMLG